VPAENKKINLRESINNNAKKMKTEPFVESTSKRKSENPQKHNKEEEGMLFFEF
jgi:hypothetical protein